MKTVYRRDGESVDSLIRRYRRKREREGIAEALKEKEAYTAPSGKRRRKSEKAAWRRTRERRH